MVAFYQIIFITFAPQGNRDSHMYIEDILLATAVVGVAAGLYICLKPSSKKKSAAPAAVPAPKVIEAENVTPIDESDNGKDPANGIELSEEETVLIDADPDLEEIINSTPKEELRSLNYTFPSEKPEEKKENAVSVAEDDGRTYFPAPEHDGPDPEFFRH